MNHEGLARLLRCPACGSKVRYRPRVYSYCCEGPILHAFRVRDQVADLVQGEPEGRQKRVNRTFDRVAGRIYEKSVIAATPFERLLSRIFWGTTKFIPLLFELLDSVASDCDPGYFLDIPVGTAVFTAGEYSLQPNLEFIAADYNRTMLNKAFDRILAEDFGNIMLVRTDARSLPFLDESFTGVMTMNGIGVIPDSDKVLDEVTRVLKPGGKIAGCMNIRGERLLTDILSSTVGAWLGYYTKPGYTEEQIIGELEARGVEKIVTRKVNSMLFFSARKVETAPTGRHEAAMSTGAEDESSLNLEEELSADCPNERIGEPSPERQPAYVKEGKKAGTGRGVSFFNRKKSPKTVVERLKTGPTA